MSELEQVAFAVKMHEFIEQVVPYLQPEQRLDVREQGLEVLLSQMQVLIGINDEDLTVMINAVALCLDKPSMLTSALTLLVNISAECGQIFQKQDMNVMYKYCYKVLKKNNSVDLILMFMTNVTTMEEKAREMIWLQDEEDILINDRDDTLLSSSSSQPLEPPPVKSLATFIISKCLEYNPQIEPDQLHASLVAWDEVDPWQYSNNILCNIR